MENAVWLIGRVSSIDGVAHSYHAMNTYLCYNRTNHGVESLCLWDEDATLDISKGHTPSIHGKVFKARWGTSRNKCEP